MHKGRERCAIANAKPCVLPVKVALHRALGNAQQMSNFAIGEAVSDQMHDVALE
jgi:hypothetical protein